jgi:hypothetical protein
MKHEVELDQAVGRVERDDLVARRDHVEPIRSRLDELKSSLAAWEGGFLSTELTLQALDATKASLELQTGLADNQKSAETRASFLENVDAALNGLEGELLYLTHANDARKRLELAMQVLPELEKLPRSKMLPSKIEKSRVLQAAVQAVNLQINNQQQLLPGVFNNEVDVSQVADLSKVKVPSTVDRDSQRLSRLLDAIATSLESDPDFSVERLTRDGATNLYVPGDVLTPERQVTFRKASVADARDHLVSSLRSLSQKLDSTTFASKKAGADLFQEAAGNWNLDQLAFLPNAPKSLRFLQQLFESTLDVAE